MLAQASKPSSREVEAGGEAVQDFPHLYRELEASLRPHLKTNQQKCKTRETPLLGSLSVRTTDSDPKRKPVQCQPWDLDLPSS